MDIIRRDRFLKRPAKFSRFLSYYYSIVNNTPQPFQITVEELVDGHLIYIDGLRENIFQAIEKFRDRVQNRPKLSPPEPFDKRDAEVIIESKYEQIFPPLTLRSIFDFGRMHTRYSQSQRILELDKEKGVIITYYRKASEFEISFESSLLSLGVIFQDESSGENSEENLKKTEN